MKKMISWPFKFMKSLYNWTLCWAKTKNSSYALFSIAFIESSFFPIPPDVLLIPMVIAEPRSWWKKALICTVGSILGALLGYVVGKIFYDIIGITILNFYNLQSAVTVIGEKYANNAFLSIFAGAFTPIPYKVMTISAGIFDISLPILIIASIFGRGGRFFIISVALKIFGAKIQTTVEKNFNLLSIIFLVLLITGFVVLKHIT
ncbi:MAG: VTT domain-containing protein [Endomicrobium sp.]|jgi:membrane protein YqaA with SNARE-associated domain|nr:VTT domain-containing protein [Endomicrobium sp.]